jgi:predicted molibdopterin-dependent oxidoreductase YjgC
MKELADHWKVEPEVIPHWSVPTHILQILSHAENGLIHFIWIVATNPLVSLPDLKRVRDILAKENIFIVVSDGFLTETADYADVVLPAALWGEKTGTFTNTDRTVHITHKAVDPPGQARSDLDIFLEFARRLELKNKYGEPLVWWENAEETFEAWRQCTKGSSCDYSGITYEALSQTSGIQWPCNERFPNGCERLYSDGIFPTDIETCESFGHDLETGAKITKEEYEAMNPDGRAILKAASYIPPFEAPDEEFPLWLTTGRNVYHFHTRTKTGRTKLNDAEPHMYVEVNPVDAKQHGLNDGDRVKVSSRRGHIFGTVRIVDVLEGTIFLPFHYGYWDIPDHLKDVAANELTLPYFDPVSKQPVFKYCAVQMGKVDEMTQTKQLSEDEIQPKLGSAIDHGPQPDMQKVKNLETHLKLLFMHCDHLKCILDDMSQMKDHGIQQTMFIFKHLHESTMNEMNNVYERYQLSSVDVKFSFENYSLPDSKSMLPSNLTSEYQALLRIQLLGTHVSFSQFACNSLVVAAKAAMIHDLGSELVKVRTYLSKIYKWVNTQMSIRSPEALNCPNDC